MNVGQWLQQMGWEPSRTTNPEATIRYAVGNGFPEREARQYVYSMVAPQSAAGQAGPPLPSMGTERRPSSPGYVRPGQNYIEPEQQWPMSSQDRLVRGPMFAGRSASPVLPSNVWLDYKTPLGWQPMTTPGELNTLRMSGGVNRSRIDALFQDALYPPTVELPARVENPFTTWGRERGNVPTPQPYNATWEDMTSRAAEKMSREMDNYDTLGYRAPSPPVTDMDRQQWANEHQAALARGYNPSTGTYSPDIAQYIASKQGIEDRQAANAMARPIIPTSLDPIYDRFPAYDVPGRNDWRDVVDGMIRGPALPDDFSYYGY